jgi:hypothetical protein
LLRAPSPDACAPASSRGGEREIGERLAASPDIQRLSDTACINARGLALLLMVVWNPLRVDADPDEKAPRAALAEGACACLRAQDVIRIAGLWQALALVSLGAETQGAPLLTWVEGERSQIVKCAASSLAECVSLDIKHRRRAIYVLTVSSHAQSEAEPATVSPSSCASRPFAQPSPPASTGDPSGDAKRATPAPRGTVAPSTLAAAEGDAKGAPAEGVPSWANASFFASEPSPREQPLGRNTLLARAVDWSHRMLWDAATREDAGASQDSEPHVLALVVDRGVGFLVQAYYGLYSGAEWLAFESDLKPADGLPAPASGRYHRLRPLDPAPAHRGLLDPLRLAELALDVDRLAVPRDDQRARFARISGVLKAAALVSPSYRVAFTRCTI